MTPASDIQATSPASPAVAAQRVSVSGGHAMASDKVEAASPTSFSGITAQWRSDTERQANQDSEQSDRQPQSPPRSGWLTPLLFRAALGFAAVAPMQHEIQAGNPPMFLTDLKHGLGIYEFNMKLMVASQAPQGSVVNQFT